MPLEKECTANERREHNVEKYIQWGSTLSLTIRVYLHSFTSCCHQNVRNSPKIRPYISTRSSIFVPIESSYATSY